MDDNVTATQETKVTRSVQVLETFHLNKKSLLYKDMENILERKKSGQLKFHTHEEIWKERNVRVL